jgi:hypothetical protein
MNKDNITSRLLKTAANSIEKLEAENKSLKVELEKKANDTAFELASKLAEVSGFPTEKILKMASSEHNLLRLCEHIVNNNSISSVLETDGSTNTYTPKSNFKFASERGSYVESAEDYVGVTYEEINKHIMEKINNGNY